MDPNGRNLVAGNWVEGDGPALLSADPSNGRPVWRGATASNQQVHLGVASARHAQRAWEATPLEQRSMILKNFVQLVEENSEMLAELVTAEVGKPLWESRTEVAALRAKLTPTLEFYDRRASTDTRELGSVVSSTRYRPLGVCAVIGPFNFPLSMVNTHVMPALLAGNCVIIKPSEHAPALANAYAELLIEAGVPGAVISVLHGGPDTALSLVDLCDGVFLTGSKAAGDAIRDRASGRSDVLLALEMGGNSPLVIWDYDSVEPVVLGVIQSAFISAGQRCSAARRVICRADDDTFIERLASTTRALHVADPMGVEQPYFGPMISSAAVDRLSTRYEDLIQLGADVIVPLETVSKNFVRPCILDVTGLDPGDVEHFGPMILLVRVQSLEEAIEVANATEYGLAAGIYCRDRDVYEDFFARTRAGIVNWNQPLTGAVGNAPFGGAKASGNHRPGGSLSVDYCVYAVASLEVAEPQMPTTIPPGVVL